VLIAQVTIADVATIVAVPLVLQPSRASHAALGGLLVAGCALAIFAVARSLQDRDWVRRIRRLSKHREWALDLRLSLLVLFTLAWIAQKSGTSVLIAGFGAGLMVAAIGGPERLSTQVRGIAEGFFVPLFFVVLGARLDLTALADHPRLLAISGGLIGLSIVIHVIARVMTRQPPGSGLIATAQLGVPAAVVQIGLLEQVITAAEGAAIIVAALASLLTCAVGASILAGRISRAETS
jgi:Kef-type K+ transport system membrane component KefB